MTNMTEFLVPPHTGLSEVVMGIMDGLLVKGSRYPIYSKKTFNPMKNAEFARIFMAILTPYKDKIPNYYQRMSDLRQHLRVKIDRNGHYHDADGYDYSAYASAEPDDYLVMLHRPFFRQPQYCRRILIEHELTHIVQGLFQPRPAGRPKKSGKGNEWSAEPGYNYWQDPEEVECFAKDIYYEIVFKRGHGGLKQRRAVVNFIERHEHFTGMNFGQKRRYFRTIFDTVFGPGATEVLQANTV